MRWPKEFVQFGRAGKQVIRRMPFKQGDRLPPPCGGDTFCTGLLGRFDIACGITHHPGVTGVHAEIIHGLADMDRFAPWTVTAVVGVHVCLQALIGESTSHDLRVIGSDDAQVQSRAQVLEEFSDAAKKRDTGCPALQGLEKKFPITPVIFRGNPADLSKHRKRGRMNAIEVLVREGEGEIIVVAKDRGLIEHRLGRINDDAIIVKKQQSGFFHIPRCLRCG